MSRKYSFADHRDHEARLPEWRDRWIANALSTRAMDEADRAACIVAVHGLYAAAKLPPPKHVVFVPSPFVLTFAGGFAASIWYCHRHAATSAATTAAVTDAAHAVTVAVTTAARAAVTDATTDATHAAVSAATLDAVTAATAAHAAVTAATHDAARAAVTAADATDDLAHWYVFPWDIMRQCSAELGVGDFGIECAALAWQMWQGGNQWPTWDSYLSFFQEVAELPIDYTHFRHWRVLAERSGPRIMHPDFCMISDRPELLTVDDRNRPHGEAGPFCRWRDGSALYSWHGTRVPARWIVERETLDPNEVLRNGNVELVAAGRAIIGMTRFRSALKGKVIDDSGSPTIGRLVEYKLEGLRQPGRFLEAECPRNGTICEGVPMVSDIDGLPIDTALAAQAWRIGDPQSEYQHPTVRT